MREAPRLGSTAPRPLTRDRGGLIRTAECTTAMTSITVSEGLA